MLNLPRRATAVQLLVDLGRDHGVEPQQCLDGSGVDAARLAHADSEVLPDAELAVIRNLQKLLGHVPGLGLLAGRRVHLTAYGAGLGMALLTSATVREAVDLGARYLELMFPFYKISFEQKEGEFHILTDDSRVPDDVRQFLIERDAASAATLVRDMGLGQVHIKRIHTRLQPPPHIDLWRRLFGEETALNFGAAENRTVIAEHLLDKRLPQRNPHAQRLYEAQVQEELAKQQSRGGIAGRVRERLRATLDELPTIERIAGALKTPPWTLRRELSREGTSFRALMEEVRRAIAEELLKTGARIEQVALRLGYSEPAAFTHAFTRWTGEAPQAFRARFRRG